MLNTYDILTEAKAIFDGNASGYHGDGIGNCSSFLRSIGRDFCGESEIIIRDITNNLSALSELTGWHPDRCKWAANRISEGRNNKLMS